MVRAERVVLRFFVITLINININAANIPVDTSEILSRLLGKRSYASPLILIISRSSNNNNKISLRSDDHQVLTGGDRKKVPDDTVDDAKAKHYMKQILKATGDENDPEVIETNQKFGRALRSRCTLYIDCTIKCKKERKVKKKDKCEKSCKDVYDYLMICNPPGGKKNKTKKKDSCEDSLDSCGETKPKPSIDSCESSEEDSCGEKTKFGKGKTMPPTWPK